MLKLLAALLAGYGLAQLSFEIDIQTVEMIGGMATGMVFGIALLLLLSLPASQPVVAPVAKRQPARGRAAPHKVTVVRSVAQSERQRFPLSAANMPAISY